MSPVPNDPVEPDLDDGLISSAFEAQLAIARVECELRTLSLDLWIAGWTPDELLDHVRRSVADVRADGLLVLVLLVDDSFRSDQSRPPEWRTVIDRLRAVTGTTLDDLRPGWIARWVLANSTYETSGAAAQLLHDLRITLTDLVCPLLDGAAPDIGW